MIEIEIKSVYRRSHGAPKGDTNSLKHGLFAKYLPQEVYEIAQELTDKQPIDIPWENITLTYANLLPFSFLSKQTKQGGGHGKK